MASDFNTAYTAYFENADYDVTFSIAKARAFAVACRQLLLLMPAVSESNKNRTELNPTLINSELKAAKNWLAVNDSDNQPNSVVFADFRGGRT